MSYTENALTLIINYNVIVSHYKCLMFREIQIGFNKLILIIVFAIVSV